MVSGRSEGRQRRPDCQISFQGGDRIDPRVPRFQIPGSEGSIPRPRGPRSGQPGTSWDPQIWPSGHLPGPSRTQILAIPRPRDPRSWPFRDPRDPEPGHPGISRPRSWPSRTRSWPSRDPEDPRSWPSRDPRDPQIWPAETPGPQIWSAEDPRSEIPGSEIRSKASFLKTRVRNRFFRHFSSIFRQFPSILVRSGRSCQSPLTYGGFRIQDCQRSPKGDEVQSWG